MTHNEVDYLRKFKMAHVIDELLKDLLLDRPPNPWRFLSQRFEKLAKTLEEGNSHMPHLEMFGLAPSLDIRLNIGTDDHGYPMYEVVGPDALVANLRDADIQPKGRMCPRHGLTLCAEKRQLNHIPEDAQFYVFMYPPEGLTDQKRATLLGLTNDTKRDDVDALRSSMCHGAFLYFGKNNEILQVNGLSEGHGLLFDDPLLLEDSFVAELDRKGCWQRMTLECIPGAEYWAWMPEFSTGKLPNEVGTHGGFVFKMKDGEAYWYGLSEMDLTFLEAVVPMDESEIRFRRKGQANEELMRNCVNLAGGFAMGYPVTNLKSGQTYSLQNSVPYELRLTTAMLVMLGRDDSNKTDFVKSGKGHWEFCATETNVIGLNNVTLSKPLSTWNVDFKFNADIAERALRQWFGDERISQRLQETNVQSLRNIFGDQELMITANQIRQLNHTYRCRLAPLLPAQFYKALVKLTADDRYIQYFWENKAATFSELLKVEPSRASNAEAHEKYLALMDEVGGAPEKFGFKAKKEHQELLERSLTEISTSTVISGEIIFLSGNHGQITPLAADQQNVVLISTAGIDFDEPARNPAAGREEAQYFKITKQLPNGDVEGDWINEAAHAAFKERIKLVYDMIFRSCEDHQVTHLSLIPMGLGVFLPRIRPDDVKRIYIDAQLELLQNDYGFHTVFLNPGPAKRQVEETLQSNRFKFKCNFMIHRKNGKYLAQQLAKAGLKTGLLNPSDCIAMLQGRMGYWWEVGRGSRYVGEEDIAATSTAVLMQSNITDLYDSDRIDQHEVVQAPTNRNGY